MKKSLRAALEIKGIVQGVGFRPFLLRTARRLSLAGFAKNTAHGVYAEIEGAAEACEAFIACVENQAPPMARVEGVEVTELAPTGQADFRILPSAGGAADTFVSPDIGICDRCLADILNVRDRRFGYAFTNCTACGPRFSIINDIPYDRANTTMADFELCPDCRAEYENPLDRRFHAQPTACPVCGPQVKFEADGAAADSNPFDEFERYIKSGKTVAVKGLGGYHLACDALSESTVSLLRERKHRFEKPFAVMLGGVEAARKYCEVDSLEEKLLESAERPIVLLKKRPDCPIAHGAAPDNGRLGVMLPYTPLHCLIMSRCEALVMTSANISDEPMIFDDERAKKELVGISDAVLTHNRRIRRRVDDSVCIVINGKIRVVRRARGYAPEPLAIEGGAKALLAVGAQQKNTFCLAKGGYAFVSSHIGDLDGLEAQESFKAEIASFQRLFGCEPRAVACDMHPDYASTRFARSMGLPVVEIQHHKAHFAGVLAEHHEADDRVIGLVFDGTGYGEDGCIWGGEMLFGGITSSRRIGHLRYFRLPGGEAAVREPWRTAAYLVNEVCGAEKTAVLFNKFSDRLSVVITAAKAGLNSPQTSSVGRLFDAVAAIAGVSYEAAYEGQAAIELEQAAEKNAEGEYRFEIYEENGVFVFDWRGVIKSAAEDALSGTAAGVISARLHRAVIRLIADSACLAAEKLGSKKLALSGGVFQNEILLSGAENALNDKGFTVYSNERTPTNDGGISFGQAAAAAYITG